MEIRLDKFLWAVRIFKTRTLAAEECRMGRVVIDGIEAKPSRAIHVNDVLLIRKPPVIYSYRVKALTERRLPAKEVELYLENLTPETELDKLNMVKLAGFLGRDRGAGRPTKKDRRDIDRLKNSSC